MAHQLDSLETLSRLLYLLRRSLDDPAKAKTYLDIVDKVLIDITANGRHHPEPKNTELLQGIEGEGIGSRKVCNPHHSKHRVTDMP
jgi:hypothetical protein